ncbi:hypothetical protein RHS03_06147, partial [Rhizoctonia solani]
MLLRESLARVKSKWKRRLQLGREHTGPTPSPTKVQRLGQADLDAWPLIKASIAALDSGANWFGPLKAAIGPLVECVEIYKREWGMRKEQHKLRKKLDRIMQDLTELKRCSAEFAMTGSIQRIIADIQEEAKTINKANQKAISAERPLESMIKGTEYILECYSRIDEHLQRLALNVNINVINAVTQEAKVRSHAWLRFYPPSQPFTTPEAPSKAAAHPKPASHRLICYCSGRRTQTPVGHAG